MDQTGGGIDAHEIDMPRRLRVTSGTTALLHSMRGEHYRLGRVAAADVVRVRDVCDLAVGALVVAGAADDREVPRRWGVEVLQKLDREVALWLVGHDAVPKRGEAHEEEDPSKLNGAPPLKKGGFEHMLVVDGGSRGSQVETAKYS